MDLCYLDESGTPQIPGNTSHFVLAGLSMPDTLWKSHRSAVEALKESFGLAGAEIHTGWILRPYSEQDAIGRFETLSTEQRQAEVRRVRSAKLIALQNSNPRSYRQTRKNLAQTEPYIHLSLEERKEFVRRAASLVGSWGEARLFAECIDKLHFDAALAGRPVQEQAFEQVVSRFEQYLENAQRGHGILIHDNNESVARRHTELMNRFLKAGTLWTNIERVIETPFFVDSKLSDMVQLADLAAYALRRYLENGEEELLARVFQRADRIGNKTVGVRHFTRQGCACAICASHG